MSSLNSFIQEITAMTQDGRMTWHSHDAHGSELIANSSPGMSARIIRLQPPDANPQLIYRLDVAGHSGEIAAALQTGHSGQTPGVDAADQEQQTLLERLHRSASGNIQHEPETAQAKRRIITLALSNAGIADIASPTATAP